MILWQGHAATRGICLIDLKRIILVFWLCCLAREAAAFQERPPSPRRHRWRPRHRTGVIPESNRFVLNDWRRIDSRSCGSSKLASSGREEAQDPCAAIEDARNAAELSLRQSQVRFYEARSGRDMEAMSDLWSEDSNVRCVHPGMPAAEGRREVLESWERYFSVPVPESSSSSLNLFAVAPGRVQVEIHGTIAVCSCAETTGGGARMEAVSVYKREGGRWRMTLHQAGPVMSFA